MLVGIEPRASEDGINLFHTEARNFRNHQVHVDKGNETPPSKENEGAPIMSA